MESFHPNIFAEHLEEKLEKQRQARIEEAVALSHKIESAPSGTEKQVCDDITNRQKLGIAKYGQTVADNPLVLREWLNHAYEETLDKAVYLKRAIAEIDRMRSGPARYMEMGGSRIYPGEPGYESAKYEECYLKNL